MHRSITADSSTRAPKSEIEPYRSACRYWIWATRGHEALLAATEGKSTDGMRAFDRFEVRALEEWIAQREGRCTEADGTVLRELQAKGLFGIIALLVAVNTCPGGLPAPLMGESSAQLVARLFPDPARGSPPSGILIDL